jgi:predicted Zn-dependent protease
MAERIALALAALAAAAGFAFAFTAARAEDELFRLQFADRPDAARAAALERRAARLTPGERRAILLAQVRMRAGDADGAAAVLRAAAAREPENAEVWLGLSRAAEGSDPALARRAAQRVRALVPPVPAP